MRKDGRTREPHQAFRWTADRLQQLKDAYAACSPMPLRVAAHTIATALGWPELSINGKLMQLYPTPVVPLLPMSLSHQQLAGYPIVETGPFLWDVQIERRGRCRWSLRYRYGEWPWLVGQVVSYQDRLYRVQRVGCASLVVVLIQTPGEARP